MLAKRGMQIEQYVVGYKEQKYLGRYASLRFYLNGDSEEPWANLFDINSVIYISVSH